MNLLLTSAGFTTQVIADMCAQMVGKPDDQISFAIINEAYAKESGDQSWIIEELGRLKQFFPKSQVTFVNLLAKDNDQIMASLEPHDAIYVLGGWTDYLMDVYTNTGLVDQLPKLLETKTYIGSSAGGMVLGVRLDDQAYDVMYQETNEARDIEIDQWMELVNFSVMPHMDSPTFENRRETLLEAAKRHSGVIYGLRDDAALAITDGAITQIGSDPLIINDGEIREN